MSPEMEGMEATSRWDMAYPCVFQVVRGYIMLHPHLLLAINNS